MRTRRLLAATMTLGLLVTGIGFTGIYAVFTDRATTGENSVTTDQEPRVADIRIASVDAPGDCATADYTEDLLTGIVNANSVRPGWADDPAYLCFRNVGASDITLSTRAIDVTDVDIACTGDEEAAGDESCGEDGEGELAAHLNLVTQFVSCTTGTPDQGTAGAFSAFVAQSLPAGQITSGATRCFEVVVSYPEPSDPIDAQLAQSDEVTWRFAFDAVPVPAP
jgi:hypothetical protein